MNNHQKLRYPLAPFDEWHRDRTYRLNGGRMTYMTPNEFLERVKPLTMDPESRENIDILKDHILSGGTLDPLLITRTGREDGRHRAHAALELEIKQVPVIVYV